MSSFHHEWDIDLLTNQKQSLSSTVGSDHFILEMILLSVVVSPVVQESWVGGDGWDDGCDGSH